MMMQYPSNQNPATGFTGDMTGVFTNQAGTSIPQMNPDLMDQYLNRGGFTGGMMYPGGSPTFREVGGQGTPVNSTPSGIQGGTVLGQVGAGTYNPMAGWDTAKLNDPSKGKSIKYQFGRFVQDQKYDPVWARKNLSAISDAFNKAYGYNTRVVPGKDDTIDFGQPGWNPIDVLNAHNYWQWLLPTNDSGQGAANSMAPGMSAQTVSGQGAQPYVKPGNFLMNNQLGMFGSGGPSRRTF